MEKLKFWIKTSLVFYVYLIVICCQKENSFSDEQMIEFELNLMEENSETLLKSSESINLEDGAKIIITITTTSGWYIGITSAEYDLQKLGDKFLSEKIMLKKGCYKLKEFMIVDSAGNIIFAAPTEGTTLGNLVNTPLPLDFCVGANESKKIPVDVINTDNKVPEDFGIASFNIISPSVIKFPVAVVDYETGEFLAATIEVTNIDWDCYLTTRSKQPLGIDDAYRKTIQVQPVANSLMVLDDTYPSYSFKVSKEGYTSFTYTYTKDSLLHYALPEEKRTLKIEIASTAIDSITDINGNIYKTVKIGSQVWMQENLHVSKYNDGSDMNVYEVSWVMPEGVDFNPDNAMEAFYEQNILLNSKKLCPVGWHIPTMNDWRKLVDFLGGSEVAGGKLKGGDKWARDDTWYTSNLFGEFYTMDNLSNFIANPYSTEYFDHDYKDMYGGGYYTSFIVSSQDGQSFSIIYLHYASYEVQFKSGFGGCLRCIKDESK